MNEEANRRRRLEHDLRRALADDEFVLHYQPILSLRSGRVESVEALVRWQHPKLGLLAPGSFIELAERTGLIRQLGHYVLEQACRQAARWHAQGLDLKVAINLSGVQLRDPRLMEQIEQVLARTGLPPPLLEFELTETILMDSSLPATRSFLTGAIERDFCLAIDDFGDACSIFTYLREPAIRRLKISQSVVSSLPDNAEAAKLVAALIAFAHGLDREIVAEAVETEAQLEFLKEHGCDHVQGYLLCRPLPAKRAETFLRSHDHPRLLEGEE
jgi:EAL domain-containing protein (putative c-di-GMP-specific phosphodiesterase class I)